MSKSVRTLRERFDRLMPENLRGEGCWIWVGGVNNHGYPMISGGRRGVPHVRVRRFVWEEFVGPLDPDLRVGTTCDEKRCVNPAHLVAMKHGDIVRAWVDRNGSLTPSGEDNGAAKLTDEQVAQIRNLSLRGRAPKELAAQFETPYTTIIGILSGRRRR